jgi:P-type Cu+ transporter
MSPQRHHQHSSGADSPHGPVRGAPSSTATGQLVTDPVCGMQIDPKTARGGFVTHNAETIHFCSSGCREKFKAAPDRYSQPPSGAGAAPESNAPASTPKGTYVCPMHPEVRQQGPGACSKCGMALEPEVPATSARTEYVCPMHPEIVRDAPGSCPTFGMALEPRHATRCWGSAALSFKCRRGPRPMLEVSPAKRSRCPLQSRSFSEGSVPFPVPSH